MARRSPGFLNELLMDSKKKTMLLLGLHEIRKEILMLRSEVRLTKLEEIAKDICGYLISHNGKDFNLTKAYDLFVASMITNIMNGNKIVDCDKLNIKSIVGIFERLIKNGNIQKRLPPSF